MRDKVSMAVQDKHLCISDGPADRDRAICRPYPIDGGPNRCFSRPVHIPELSTMWEKFLGKITGKRLTPAQNLQPRRTLPSDMQKGTPCRRGRLHHGAVRFSHSF